MKRTLFLVLAVVLVSVQFCFGQESNAYVGLAYNPQHFHNPASGGIGIGTSYGSSPIGYKTNLQRNSLKLALASSGGLVLTPLVTPVGTWEPSGNDIIYTAGNVGIGTTSPTAYSNKTTVAVDGTWGGRIDNMLGGAVKSSWYQDTSNHTYFGSTAASSLFLTTDDAIRLSVLHTSGNVGIGTTSPVAPLHIVKDTVNPVLRLRNTNDAKTTSLYFESNDNLSGAVIDFAHSDAEKSKHHLALGVNGYTLFLQNSVLGGNGNVGIGTASPSAKLQVEGSNSGLLFDGSTTVPEIKASASNMDLRLSAVGPGGWLALRSNGVDRVHVDAAGKVGIGTATPTTKLDIENAGIAMLELTNVLPGGVNFQIGVGDNGLHKNKLVIAKGSDMSNPANILMTIDQSSPGSTLDVKGTTTTDVLSIRGGTDLAEPFPISDSKPIAPGSVVVIDDKNPGQLKLSGSAYDTRVAGIVSGANGVNPGITLQQDGLFDEGQNVALTGRVYAMVNTSNGPVKPGDLLTTSAVPGQAMKVTDYTRAQGAIIGKAMSSLNEGQGLVLVLVTLQ